MYRKNEPNNSQQKEIAILIPCYNEEQTIAKVITDFRNVLPYATIYVCDNNSSDATAEIAAKAGAKVIREIRQGKGYAVRRLFQAVSADLYVLVDGDDTYSATHLNNLILYFQKEEAEMVIGTRLEEHQTGSFRHIHKFGNYLITLIINIIFNSHLTDILSGYRVFSRNYVKGIPLISKGFEIETEMTLNALDYDLPIIEVPVPYGKRPDGSVSKLNTFRDGLLIIKTIFKIFRDYRPLLFFGIFSVLFILSGLALGIPVVVEYMDTGLVPRLPTAVLAASFGLLAFQLIGVGLILDTLTSQRRCHQQLQWQQMISDKLDILGKPF
jgi:glycosyltransferase involved in cell wall biosynthesis